MFNKNQKQTLGDGSIAIQARGNVTIGTNTHEPLYLDDYNLYGKDSFENIYNFDSVHINDLFIEPNFSVQKVRIDEEPEPLEVESNFTDLSQELLNQESSILFIVGLYGLGKSFLSKYLCLTFSNEYKDILYISMPDLLSSSRAINSMSLRRNTYSMIVVDGLDEINYEDLMNNFFQKIKSLGLVDAKIILNTRLYLDIESSTYTKLSELVYLILDKQISYFIRLENFNRKMISSWLEKYPNQHNEELKFDVSHIEEYDKKLFESCKNPLFLYQLISGSYSEGTTDLNSIFAIYKTFVNKTIRGKFPGKSHLLEYISPDQYKQFLFEISVLMYNNNITSQAFSYDNDEKHFTTVSDFIILDKNTRSYSLSTAAVIELAKHYLPDKVITSNLIHCYFFEKKTDTNWSFTDNNIMFYLIAERYLYILKNVFNHYNPDTSIPDHAFEVFKNFILVLHPLPFMFLIQMLKRDKEKFVDIFNAFKEEGKIFNHTITINDEQVNLEIFLGFLYLNLSTQNNKFTTIFSRVYQYIGMMDSNSLIRRHYHYLLKSLLRKITFPHDTIKHIDFSEFNLSRSTMNSTNYYHCVFNNTLFNNTIFINTEFESSDFKHINFDQVNGSLSFTRCTLQNVEIRSSKELKIYFHRCFLFQIHISDCDKINFVFRDNTIETMKVSHCKQTNFVFEKNRLENISLHNSQVKYSDDSHNNGLDTVQEKGSSIFHRQPLDEVEKYLYE